MSKIIEIKVPEFNDAESASDAIYKLLNQAERIEEEATKIADQYAVSFSVGDYGSGRTYYPKGEIVSQWMKDEIENNGGDVKREGNGYVITEGAWVSSSALC
ncbi:hypothetical protein KNT78_gp097 [Shigella phage phi25-307]|uniref:Uncharacterized protein n=1 Tax=Shigella phage phi25-307 TaxID=2340715 RepID=A0A386K4P4_9CAUD|nr:hypothetical protein KNT78_gp097 [Shigella phage phi25-307]AYD79339.1 hypothetical protein FFEPELFE_00097 [Shigella phage phi25-307]